MTERTPEPEINLHFDEIDDTYNDFDREIRKAWSEDDDYMLRKIDLEIKNEIMYQLATIAYFMNRDMKK